MKTIKDKVYYKTIFNSPVGNYTLACDDKENLIGLWLEGQKYFGGTVDSEMKENNTPEIFKKTKNG